MVSCVHRTLSGFLVMARSPLLHVVRQAQGTACAGSGFTLRSLQQHPVRGAERAAPMVVGGCTGGRNLAAGIARQRYAAQGAECKTVKHKAGRWAVLWLSKHSWHLTHLSLSRRLAAFPTTIIAQMFYFVTFPPEILIFARIGEQSICALCTYSWLFRCVWRGRQFPNPPGLALDKTGSLRVHPWRVPPLGI